MTRSIRLSCTVFLLSLTGAVLGAPSSKWENVATTQAQNATELAAEHVRLDAGFHELTNKFVSACELTVMIPNEDRGLGKRDWHHLYVYAKGICRPWLKRWSEETKPCDSDDAPDWCLD